MSCFLYYFLFFFCKYVRIQKIFHVHFSNTILAYSEYHPHYKKLFPKINYTSTDTKKNEHSHLKAFGMFWECVHGIQAAFYFFASFSSCIIRYLLHFYVLHTQEHYIESEHLFVRGKTYTYVIHCSFHTHTHTNYFHWIGWWKNQILCV